MKFCSKCGTQMPDETMVCPQCQAPTNNQYLLNSNQQPSQKKKNILPIVIFIALVLIILIVVYFILQSINGTTNSNTFNSTCPASQYGNHDWSSPTCIEPAQCYHCDAYRDDKLGNHSFSEWNDDCCLYCDLSKDEYNKTKN